MSTIMVFVAVLSGASAQMATRYAFLEVDSDPSVCQLIERITYKNDRELSKTEPLWGTWECKKNMDFKNIEYIYDDTMPILKIDNGSTQKRITSYFYNVDGNGSRLLSHSRTFWNYPNLHGSLQWDMRVEKSEYHYCNDKVCLIEIKNCYDSIPCETTVNIAFQYDSLNRITAKKTKYLFPNNENFPTSIEPSIDSEVYCYFENGMSRSEYLAKNPVTIDSTFFDSTGRILQEKKFSCIFPAEKKCSTVKKFFYNGNNQLSIIRIGCDSWGHKDGATVTYYYSK
jgi:hypothetical protein